MTDGSEIDLFSGDYGPPLEITNKQNRTTFARQVENRPWGGGVAFRFIANRREILNSDTRAETDVY